MAHFPLSQLTGALPNGFPHYRYALYFYPASGGDAEFLTDITGNLFVKPYIIHTKIDSKYGTGSIVLYIKQNNERFFILTDIDFTDPDGTIYKGTYYLFTLPP